MEEVSKTLDPEVAKLAGMDGAQGPVQMDSNDNFVVKAPNPDALFDIKEPSPMPDLDKLGKEKDQMLRDAMKALDKGQAGVTDKKLKLTKGESKELQKLRKQDNRPKNWPTMARDFFRNLNKDGTLEKKLKAVGLDKNKPEAFKYVKDIATDKPAPTMGAKAKIDPKTGRVIKGEQLKNIAARAYKPAYFSAHSRAGRAQRERMGFDKDAAAVVHGEPAYVKNGNFNDMKVTDAHRTVEGAQITLTNTQKMGRGTGKPGNVAFMKNLDLTMRS